MEDTVEVMIPVDQVTARLLDDPKERAAMGVVIRDTLRKRFAAELAQVIAEMKRDARAAGLTDEDIDAELAAYKAERRASSHEG